MRKTVELPSFDSVVSGGKSVLFIRQAYGYHELLIETTNVTPADIVNMKLFLDTKEIQSWAGADLNSKNLYTKLANGVNIIKLPLTRIGMLERAAEYATVIHVGVPDARGYTPAAMRLEITLGAVTAPAMKPSAIVEDAVAGLQGQIMFVKQSNFDQPVGERLINNLVDVRNPNQAFVDQIFFKSANVNKVEITIDGQEVFKRTAALNSREEIDGVRAPQTGYYVVDFIENGFGQVFDALPLYIRDKDGNPTYQAKDIRVRSTSTTAETVTTYVVSIGTLN